MRQGFRQEGERSRRYGLTRQGYSICVVFLNLFERVYAPLTAGLLQTVPGDTKFSCNANLNLTSSTSASVMSWTRSWATSAKDRGLKSRNEFKSLAIDSSRSAKWNFRRCLRTAGLGPDKKYYYCERRFSPFELVEMTSIVCKLVDLDGFEPSTSSMPWKRAPNCATGPRRRDYVPENSTSRLVVRWMRRIPEG